MDIYWLGRCPRETKIAVIKYNIFNTQPKGWQVEKVCTSCGTVVSYFTLRFLVRKILNPFKYRESKYQKLIKKTIRTHKTKGKLSERELEELVKEMSKPLTITSGIKKTFYSILMWAVIFSFIFLIILTTRMA